MNLTFKSTEPLMQLCYEVLDNGKIFAKLEFAPVFGRYSQRNHATATIDGEEFKLGSQFLVNTNTKIINSKTSELTATYYSRALSVKGKLKVDGKEYTLKRKNSGKLEYAWTSEKGEEIISYKLEGFVLNKGEVQILSEIEKDPNLKLLVTMGLYQIMLGGYWQITATKPAMIALYIIFAILLLFLLPFFIFRSTSLIQLIDIIQNNLPK